MDVVISHSPWAVITALTTSIALVGHARKQILPKFDEGERIAMKAGMSHRFPYQRCRHHNVITCSC